MASMPPQPLNMTTIDAFWNVYAGNMNVGRWSDITMPIALKTVIGQEGIRILETRFRNMIEAPVSVTENFEEGVIKITPAGRPFGHDRTIPGTEKPKSRTSNKAKIARPPNAFILYRQHHHPLVKAEYPHLHNNQISVILGTQWKQEPEVNKAKFAALALRLKVKHLQEHPGYQYQPRKPSEKKRRQTRKNGNGARTSQTKTTVTNSTSIFVSHSNSNTATASASGGSGPSINGASVIAQAASGTGPPTAPTKKESISGNTSQLSRTAGGNTVIEVGDEDVDEYQLAVMLEEHNSTIPAAPTQQAGLTISQATPVLYSEPSEDAQNDKNFYSAMVEFDAFLSSSTDLDDFFDFQAASLQSPAL